MGREALQRSSPVKVADNLAAQRSRGRWGIQGGEAVDAARGAEGGDEAHGGKGWSEGGHQDVVVAGGGSSVQ